MPDQQRREGDLAERLYEFRVWLGCRIDTVNAKVTDANQRGFVAILDSQELNTLKAVRDEMDRRFMGQG